MMKKAFLTGLAVWAFAVVLNAAPIVRIDFPCQNFWGQLTAETQLPDGVWIGERAPFYDKRKKGYTFPVFIDLAKTPGFDVTFKFTGQGKARMSPALTGYADDDRTEQTVLQVLEFAVDGDPSVKAPGKFQHWLSMTPFVAATEKNISKDTKVAAGLKYWQIFVVNGLTIRVKAKFAAGK